MRTLFLCTAVLALVLLGSGPADAQVKIDGLFFDWPSSAQLDVDPNVETTFDQGDNTDPVRNYEDTNWTPSASYFADMDIEDAFAMDDGDFIYFRVKLASIANALNIASDTSYHGGGAIAVYISVDPGDADTTGLTWGWWGSGYDYFVQVYPEDTLFTNNTQYQQGLWEHKQSGTGWDFVLADTLRGIQVAWNAGSNDVEFAVPKWRLFSPQYMANFTMPESIAVMIYAGENNGPWRADYASLPGVKGFPVDLKKPGAIAIDGLFFDWASDTQLDAAPNPEELTFAEGDDTDPPRNSEDPTWTPAPEYFGDMDLQDIYATDDEEYVYVRITMNPIANVLNIPNDTSYHGTGSVQVYVSVDPGASDTTGLSWGSWASAYDFLIQAFPEEADFTATTGFPVRIYEHKQTGVTAWDFDASLYRGAWVAWNGGANEVEMALPKAVLLNPNYLPNFTMPTQVAIMASAGEWSSPWRADYASPSGYGGYLLDLSGVTDVEPVRPMVPTAFVLEQNYPNPFNPSTTISYALPTTGRVTLRVFNVLGEVVATLVDGVQPAGTHRVAFLADHLTSGVYFARLESGSFAGTSKMLLMK